MLRVYYYFLSYRLDWAFLALVILVSCLVITRHLRRRGPQYRIPRKSFVAAGLIVVAGAILAEWGAHERMKGLLKLFASFGPTYASELARGGHELISLDTAPDDPRYLELIEDEKRWLSVNSIIADVYTFREDAQGRIRLMVDSETDYDHSGKIDDEREERTPIGEIDNDVTPEFYRALKGETVFDASFISDRWGIWVSSFTPLYAKDGHVEAAVGIDYPAEDFLRATGSIRAVCLGVALVIAAILLISGTLNSFLSAEIEERKMTQRRLEQASESAFAASAAKSEFIAVTSHEVRTPLTAIMGFASILADTKLDPTQKRYVDTMNTAGERLMELLNGILDYSRLESGKVVIDRSPWAPALLIHEVVETVSARATQRGLALLFDNQLPSALTLRGDSGRVRQVLLNLLNNALKFTSTGTVSVRAVWHPEPKPAKIGRIALSVIDTGCGIPAEKIGSLFLAFAQANSSTTRKESGTGLGLAISQRLAELMGGKLTVENNAGPGATFTLALPCEMVESGEAFPTSKRNTTTPAAAIWARTLVIDDERLNRELLKVMLRRLGLEADIAASGREGVALAAKNRYAIIFTDLEMPEMDGFNTAATIRAAESSGQRVPIVAISALTAKGTRERCLNAGMDDYLTKPVYLPAIQSSLAALLPATFPTAQLKPVPVPAIAQLSVVNV